MPTSAAVQQQDACARRFRERKSERKRKIEAIQSPAGMAEADSPERIAKRVERVLRYRGGQVRPRAVVETTEAVLADLAIDTADTDLRAVTIVEEPDAVPVAEGRILEAIINTPDFVDIRYLEGGVAASRAVGRVNVRSSTGRLEGYGTGSLVSPRLFLTNHHVLENEPAAGSSGVEFNYQDGIDGRPLEPRWFEFDPQAFFVANEERDFALVAIAAEEAQLAEFGFNPLIEAEGKAIVGEFVTIIQHPRGEKKQVSLRENRIVDMLEDFLHYETDTEPGSSGSPVFNDQWEVVGLHHASVPATDHDELGGVMNEGVRISRILRFLHEQNLPASARDLVAQLARPERIEVSVGTAAAVAQPTAFASGGTASQPRLDGSELVVPVELRVSLSAAQGSVGLGSADRATGIQTEAVVIDPDYANRRGYDPGFLGDDALEVPLPTLSPAMLEDAATFESAGGPTHVLPYHHYSVVLSKDRRLAYFTATNIDGSTHWREDDALARQSDRWFFDPRIPEELQVGEEVYADNDLDRGHLVRRLDTAWGETVEVAKIAADDTFHFTNCTPQHARFNQNKGTWAGLEDYLLYNADNLNFSASVLTGPVFDDSDDDYRGVKLPRQYWKVAAMVKEDGSLSATGYLLSQEELIKGLEIAPEEFNYGEYRTYQVPLAQIEAQTGLKFGELSKADPKKELEAFTAPLEIRTPADLDL